MVIVENIVEKKEFLKSARDKYYNGDWIKMLRDYKIRANNEGPAQLRQTLKDDIDFIEQHCTYTSCPEGYQYYSGQFRLPKSLNLRDLQDYLVNSGDNLDKVARVCIQEIVFMLKKGQ